MAPEFGKPIHQIPLIPASILKKHRVHEPLDTRFRSAARLLQALWRGRPGKFACPSGRAYRPSPHGGVVTLLKIGCSIVGIRSNSHAAATTSRHACMADALKARCVLAEVRWRWTLKVL